jgi:transposase
MENTPSTTPTLSDAEKNGLEIAYNVPYSPKLNAIERFFLAIKTTYRRHRLGNILTTPDRFHGGIDACFVPLKRQKELL